jgi:hypothetical protein
MRDTVSASGMGCTAEQVADYRDPRLAGLTDEELRGLSVVLPKLLVEGDALKGTQNRPQLIESKNRV